MSVFVGQMTELTTGFYGELARPAQQTDVALLTFGTTCLRAQVF